MTKNIWQKAGYPSDSDNDSEDGRWSTLSFLGDIQRRRSVTEDLDGSFFKPSADTTSKKTYAAVVTSNFHPGLWRDSGRKTLLVHVDSNAPRIISSNKVRCKKK